MSAPPTGTDVPITARGCAWVAGISLLLWFALAFLFFKGMS